MDEILAEFNISIRTFRRYISEINFFLLNNYKGKSVKYDYVKKVYFLSDDLVELQPQK